MMGRPPQGSLLSGHRAKETQDELKGAAGLIAAVRKIAMVTRGDPKHSDRIQSQANHNRNRADAGPYGEKTRDVHAREWQAPKKIEPFVKVETHEETSRHAAPRSTPERPVVYGNGRIGHRQGSCKPGNPREVRVEDDTQLHRRSKTN